MRLLQSLYTQLTRRHAARPNQGSVCVCVTYNVEIVVGGGRWEQAPATGFFIE